MDDTAKIALVLFIFVLFLFFIVIGPICSIWAINTLFGTEIVLSFKTWCAMAWLHMIIVSNVKVKKS